MIAKIKVDIKNIVENEKEYPLLTTNLQGYTLVTLNRNTKTYQAVGIVKEDLGRDSHSVILDLDIISEYEYDINGNISIIGILEFPLIHASSCEGGVLKLLNINKVSNPYSAFEGLIKRRRG